MNFARSRSGNRRTVIAAVLVVAVLLLVGLVAGVVWVGLYVADNIGAPGPSPTGSGPCGSADSVNIQLLFADGHTVRACTRDRPACPNNNVTSTSVGQSPTTTSVFTMGNQLRSSSRRYILLVQSNAPMPRDSMDQVIQIDPGAFLPKLPGDEPSAGSSSPRAVVAITPRDPYEGGFTAGSGSVTTTSSHGVVKGTIDADFSAGASRPDRPQPSSPPSPLRMTGTFTCNM